MFESHFTRAIYKLIGVYLYEFHCKYSTQLFSARLKRLVFVAYGAKRVAEVRM